MLPPYIKYKYDLGEGGGGVLVIGYFFYKKKMLRNIVCFYLFLIKIRQDKRLKLTRVNYTDLTHYIVTHTNNIFFTIKISLN